MVATLPSLIVGVVPPDEMGAPFRVVEITLKFFVLPGRVRRYDPG